MLCNAEQLLHAKGCFDNLLLQASKPGVQIPNGVHVQFALRLTLCSCEHHVEASTRLPDHQQRVTAHAASFMHHGHDDHNRLAARNKQSSCKGGCHGAGCWTQCH